jgi:hypothetical protein
VRVLVVPIVVLSCNCNIPALGSIALIVIGQSTVKPFDVKVSNFFGVNVQVNVPAVKVAVDPRLTLPKIEIELFVIVDEQPVKFKLLKYPAEVSVTVLPETPACTFRFIGAVEIVFEIVFVNPDVPGSVTLTVGFP